MVDTIQVIPLTPMRRTIAARMTDAKRTIPHFKMTSAMEIDALLQLRESLRGENSFGTVSLNDLFIKACAAALMDTPAINVQWAETEIHQHSTADISVVVAVQGGLSTPIVRSAESKSIWQIAREMRDLAARAAKNALKMEEIVGGSFSVSNLGMYGVDQFDAIINPPQCAILALGTAKPRVVVSAARVMRIATVLLATLSCDHRAIDGATGARFLSALRQRLQQPQDLLSSGGHS